MIPALLSVTLVGALCFALAHDEQRPYVGAFWGVAIVLIFAGLH